MEIIELDEIINFENDVKQSILENEIYLSIYKETVKKKFQCQLQVDRFIQNGRYHSQIELNILDKNGENIKEKYEPNCILMICESLCFSRRNKLIKIDLLQDKEFIEELTNLKKELMSINNL